MAEHPVVEVEGTITEDVTTTSGAEDTLDRSSLGEESSDYSSSRSPCEKDVPASNNRSVVSSEEEDEEEQPQEDEEPTSAQTTTATSCTVPMAPEGANTSSNTTGGPEQDMPVQETTFQGLENQLEYEQLDCVCITKATPEQKPILCVCKDKNNDNQKKRQVRFDQVFIREFAVTIGDHPFTTQGVPITLDWNHYQFPPVDIDLYERGAQRRRRTTRRLLLTSFQRRDRLWRAGHSLEEIEEAAKKTEKEKFRRSMNLYCLPIFVLQEAWIVRKEQVKRGWNCTRQKLQPNHSSKQRLDTVEEEEEKDEQEEERKRYHYNNQNNDSTYKAIERQVRSLHRQQLADTDLENGGLPPWRRQESPRQRRRISFRGSGMSMSRNSEYEGADDSVHSEGEYSAGGMFESSRSAFQQKQPEAGTYQTSEDSNFDYYHIRTDPRQHDKATEIILCSARRPHMRAFHASWFGFFIGFIMWFAITPLLGEVKDSLQLTNAQIWTSSMAGTAVTVLARFLMGPLCDVFGARQCMAAIVVVSAVPCALTGLVNTAAGLSAVRAFIGIAGSAFVPCQYWTSRMFAREVAGTANALVAGWGNLGGGVTQVLMGSVLFPLFKLMFRFEDEDGDSMGSVELAWRVCFVVPSVIAFLAAYVYLFHCDDSPKGDFSELVRQQQIEMVSPFMSLFSAIQNRNVLLLMVQYACCFGVEITMTNATALYLKEEFGLATEQAAAIASIFGWINLFARGLGGFFSDRANAAYGTKGRVAFQSFTLFLEGIGIVVFAFADTLAGAIGSLVFLSLWVQCSEGSTYGIVPYVNRRFTGAVIGWVGGGGTLGGVVFSFFFRDMTYQNAFFWMGVTASASSFLSILMNHKSLAAIYNDKMRAEHIKNTTNFVFHDDLPAHEEAPPVEGGVEDKPEKTE